MKAGRIIAGQVFQDLSELITLDMKGNYILGFQDSENLIYLKSFVIKMPLFYVQEYY